MNFFYCFLCQSIWISWSQGNAFPTLFLTSKHTLSIADKHHFPCEYYGLLIKYTKSHHPNWCIKVGNTPPNLPCWWVILIFFCNKAGSVGNVQFKTFTFKNNFTTPFYGTFMDGFELSQSYRATTKRQFIFYHSGH